MPPPFRLGHRPWLDGLRGAAVLVVVAEHLHLMHGGFLAMDCFFVLSGFLITALLLEERERSGAIGLRRFYQRRALRLFPALAAVLVLGLAVTHFGYPPSEARAFRREAVVAAGYASNWSKLHDVPLPTLGHTWSLSLEEQFYLLWPPLLCLLLWTRSRRAAVALVAVGIVASAAWRAVLHDGYRAPGGRATADIMRMYTGLDTRADSLLVGCAIGMLAVWGKLPTGRPARRAVALAAAAAAAAVGYFLPTQHLGKPAFYNGLFTAVALGFGAVIVHLLVNPAPVWRWALERPLLRWFGRISYSLYLIHMPLFRWLWPGGLRSVGWADTALAFAVALAGAVLLHYAVERPFLKMKARMRREPVADAPAGPPPARRAA